MILARVADLSDAFIDAVLERAAALADGSALKAPLPGSVLGLVFLDASLRTRVGFAAAAGRMGMAVVEVGARRANDRSAPESLDDTLRVASGYTDVVVARIPSPMSELTYAGRITVLNGGDGGPSAEHPTQALIDIFAIERQSQRHLGNLSIAMCGDLTMRSPRSLLAVLARRPPRDLLLVTDPALGNPDVPDVLRPIARRVSLSEIGDADVLYVAGIPHRALPELDRNRLIVTAEILAQLPDNAIVLSPMPIIDELTARARSDRRAGFLRQSDEALHVRVAVLEQILGSG